MNSGAQMLLQFRGLGGRISWDEGPLGARASRPHPEAMPICKPNMVYTVPPNVGATLVVARVVVAR